ncbi:hypothetical protein [Apilactobacillus timberlakei]|uniref:hypothetical protein n=1 Tax=Apilactobacillus timberlakei TaxID=2008380 RepID=UPI001128DE50|nr:hypothetical protein [Apilactobacillus timberlakei]TPR16277.1 hypothetical protein DYZ95_07875 [Apilactobacillus timberlakei]TPR21552.1 hypothetical protein DY083_05895 [Apilactobacillus timberlakei]
MERSQTLIHFKSSFRKSSAYTIILDNDDFIRAKYTQLTGSNNNLLVKNAIFSINKLDRIYRLILFYKFFDIEYHSDISIYIKLNISESSFYRYEEIAIVQFKQAMKR